jgi:hypothetical protein
MGLVSVMVLGLSVAKGGKEGSLLVECGRLKCVLYRMCSLLLT